MEGRFELGVPTIEINLENEKLKVMLDTGFNGELMLPENVINELKLEPIGITDYITASGDKYVTQIYKAKIKMFDEENEIAVLSTPMAISLVGMQLFHFCKITLERHKDKVEIEKTS